MHLHLWESPDSEPIEADLKPSDIYNDHIQWCGTVTIDGKVYHLELRQWTTAPGEQQNPKWVPSV